jgi:8-oxo-dGTP pyrophosphatase MutT (NUDIX family)
MGSEEDCFHLGVKAFIRNSEGKVLLLEKRKYLSQETYWDIPGGRLQKGESLLDALRREVEEETGLKNVTEVTPLRVHLSETRISTSRGDVGLVISIYKCNTCYDFSPSLSSEHINFGWFHIVEAVDLLKSQYPIELTDSLKQWV